MCSSDLISDRATERVATYDIEQLEPAGPVAELTDATLADQLGAFMWTAFKLMTLHRTVLPELLTETNTLVTAEAASLGSENTTPDNLYMLGMFDLDPGQALVMDIEPPDCRYWSITLESIWHECLDPFRTRSSGTQAGFTPRPDGTVRVVIAADDPGVPNWLATGGRGRGYVVLRWLDNPAAPRVALAVAPLQEVSA